MLCGAKVAARDLARQRVAEAEIARRQLVCTPELVVTGVSEIQRMRAANDAFASALILQYTQPQARPFTCTTTGNVTTCR